MEDTKVRRAVSPTSYQYQPIEFESKSEHILQHNDTATTKDSHLLPREFPEPRLGNTFSSPRTCIYTSSRIDLRYIFPAASLICLVSVVPLIVYAATNRQVADIKYLSEYDTYDCS